MISNAVNPRSNRKIQLLLCAVMMILGVSITLLNAMIEKIVSACGSDMDVGYYLSVYAAGLVCSTLASSTFADRTGKKRVILVSLSVLAMGHIAVAFASSALSGFIGVFVMGLGFSTTEAISSAALTDIDPESATKWVNLSQIFFCVGAVVTPVVSTWLYVNAHVSHTLQFLVLAFTELILVAVCRTMAFGAPVESKNQEKVFINPLRLLSSMVLLIACLQAFLYICYEAIETSYLRFYFQSIGYGETLSASASSVFWATMVLGRMVGTQLSGKEHKSITAFSAIFIVGVAVLITGKALWSHMLGAALLGFGCGPVWTMIFVIGSKEYPQYSGAAFSLMMLFTNFASMLAPVLFVTLVDNLRISMLLCGVFAAIIIALNQISSRKLKSR